MINGISSSQNEYTLIATDVEKSKNAINGEIKHSDEKDLGYKLSLSDENWKFLGNKDENENDKENGELSEEDLRKVEELKKIDKRVHAHEQAHLSAAGGYARGGANYDYVTGPDGNRYANAGHVNIDTSKEKTPEATIRKANTIQKAALAPADPSPADRQIATDAAKMAADAQKELAQKKKPELENTMAPQNNNAQNTHDEPQATVKEAS
jgi:hypothetical protein